MKPDTDRSQTTITNGSAVEIQVPPYALRSAPMEGVVIEVVQPRCSPRSPIRGGPSPSGMTRYVVQTQSGIYLRNERQIQVVAA